MSASYPSIDCNSGRILYDLNHLPIENKQGLLPFVPVLLHQSFLTIDVETTGLHVGARIRSLQVGFLHPRPMALVLLLEHEDGSPWEERRSEAQQLLSAVSQVQLWAYSDFDRRMIASDLGVPLPINNAAALHHLVNSWTAARSSPLKTEIARRTGKRASITAQQTLELAATDPAFLEYAALDALGLAVCVSGWLDECGWHDRRLQEWLARERRIEDACRSMSDKGLQLDNATAHRMLDAARASREAHRQRVEQLSGVDNPRSSKRVLVAIEARGVEVPTVRRKKKSGEAYASRSTSHKHLKTDDELVLAVQGFRKQDSIIGNIEQWLRLRGSDGRIRTRFKPLGCVTSRWSSVKPNLQNVGKGSEDGAAGEDLQLRSAFVAGPGYVWVQADLSQIEYRVAAALSGDRNMLDAFARGEDIHVYTAKVLSGVAEPTKRDRKFAKGIGFGKLYGESVEAGARKLGVTVEEMQARVDRYDEEFPELAAWCLEIAEASESGRTPPNPYGRTFPVAHGYMGVNYVVQSTAREVFCDWMLSVVEAGYGPFLAAGLHDELVAEVPEEMAAEVRDAFVRCADAVEIPGYEGRVQIVAEARIARGAWSAAYTDD